MKIGIVSSTVFKLGNNGLPGYGGLEVVAWHQARGLAAKGHDVTLFAPDGSACPGCRVVPFGPAGRVDEEHAYGGFPEIRDGDKVLREAHKGYWQELLNQDVITDHSWGKWPLCLKAEGRLKAPVLTVFHAPVDTMFKAWPPDYPGVGRVGRPCAVCISRDQANHFEALYGGEARVCHNGIDPEHYRRMDGVARTDRYLFLARFSTIKGPDIAIDACKRTDVGLDLIGDTSITNEPHYFEHCKAQCDGNRIRMVGPCSRGESVYWYSRAHAFLHPNQRFREPLGLAPLEAQACGLPVVAWRYGAMPETVRHGETGYLVRSVDEMVDAIRTLNALPAADMTAMRDACVAHARQFTVRRMVDRYEELCKEAVDTGGW